MTTIITPPLTEEAPDPIPGETPLTPPADPQGPRTPMTPTMILARPITSQIRDTQVIPGKANSSNFKPQNYPLFPVTQQLTALGFRNGS